MKIKYKDYEALKDIVWSNVFKILAASPDISTVSDLMDLYETGQFPRADKVNDLNRRFCFDIAAGAAYRELVCDTLYKYLDDDHIYTALKAICPTVTRRY